MKLTKEILDQGKSINGYWSKKQLTLLGLDFFHLRKGWKRSIIGWQFSPQTIDEFVSLKDKHIKASRHDGTRQAIFKI